MLHFAEILLGDGRARARRASHSAPRSRCIRTCRARARRCLTNPDRRRRSGGAAPPYNEVMKSHETIKVKVAKDLEDLIPVFLSNRNKEVDSLRVALAAADFEQLRQLGHRMKGVGNSYGFAHVSTLGKHIEDGARSGDSAALEARIERVRRVPVQSPDRRMSDHGLPRGRRRCAASSACWWSRTIPTWRRFLARLLRAEGMAVDTVARRRGGARAHRGLAPDLVLLDVMMPGTSGFEICERLKADPATALIPVVLVTALEDQQSRVRGIEAGADDFLSKPVNREELVARVQDAAPPARDAPRARGAAPGCRGASARRRSARPSRAMSRRGSPSGSSATGDEATSFRARRRARRRGGAVRRPARLHAHHREHRRQQRGAAC